MAPHAVPVGDRAILEANHLQDLIDALTRHSYRVIGPTVRDGAIAFGDIHAVADLPAGWTDDQAPGRYRLKRRRDKALFAHNVGPHSVKPFLHPPTLTLFAARREDGGFAILPRDDDVPAFAFLGLRACDLAALAIQDRVLLGGEHPDAAYRARREKAFLVAAACTQASPTCFCASMNTGPLLPAGFDLALTEILENKRHAFLLSVGSERGEAIAAELPLTPPTPDDLAAAARATQKAEAQIDRSLDMDGLHDLLAQSYTHARWDDVANRCLSCANCTMVCPTCFCTTIEDTTDLSGQQAERRQRWDSCFTADFSYIHGGSVRASVMSRYRQWMTHKLATWTDQFGTPGCVGCGRCLTWCPAGIDITEEARAIRQTRRPEDLHAIPPGAEPEALFPEWQDE